MTTKFYICIPFIFEHEGGYNDVKNDNGGATNWGISLRFLKSINGDIDGDGDVDWLDIQKLTKDHAMELYYYNFWKVYYEAMSDALAAKVFDTAVNCGNTRANILLQKAFNSLGSNLQVDGIIGRGTLAEILRYTEQAILIQFCIEQMYFYDSLIKKNPEQKKFINGWHARASWRPKL